MTFLQIINSLLRRLRFAEATSVDQDAYTKLLQEFVNDTKREVEDTWPWLQLRQTIQITTSSGVFRYTFTGAGKRYKLMQDSMGRPSVWNDTEDIPLYKAPSMRWMTQRLNFNNLTNNVPIWFDINGQDNGDPQVDLYPPPDGTYTINFDLVIPQDDLSSDSDTLTVPEYPVILGAWARALQDRGEDNGTPVASAIAQYQEALADAIAIENMNSADSENVWTVV